MAISKFSAKTNIALQSYVYIYSDPDTKTPFYVGKGEQNRVFNHLSDKNEKEKTQKIEEIRSRGKESLIEILIHGVDSQTALKVEAAVIDLIGIDNLTNQHRGHGAEKYGRKDAEELNFIYGAKPLAKKDILEKAIVLKINRNYRYGMSLQEIYNATKCCWEVNKKRAQRVQYALAVWNGIVVEVFKIADWFDSDETTQNKVVSADSKRKRYEFDGEIAKKKIRSRYIGKSVSAWFKSGAVNPIMYINVPA